jgi:hypothetical protein
MHSFNFLLRKIILLPFFRKSVMSNDHRVDKPLKTAEQFLSEMRFLKEKMFKSLEPDGNYMSTCFNS